jgi:acyl phosphate:glycerol-3-phosphate acyltransferase
VDLLTFIVVTISAYLLGSIPTGFLVGKARGVDIRKIGSGNIGATNTFRAVGIPAGILVLVVDGLKGYAACTWLVDGMAQLTGSGATLEHLRIAGGLAALLGHNYTCWLKFKGGKGIATSAGVLGALVPWGLAISFGVWVMVFLASRYVSLASVAAAIILPFGAWLTKSSLTLVLVTGAMGLLAVYKHRANIQRLMKGTESRVGYKKREATS